MKQNLLLLLIFCCSLVSCKSNLIGKEISYLDDNGSGFEMDFTNDSIITVRPRAGIDINAEATYKYHLLEKEVLESIKDNQPVVNFKTAKLHGQFYQNIAIELVKGENRYFKAVDTLTYLKMRIDNKLTKRIYFDGGNQFVEL